jgi:hypothetical protein
MSRLLVLTLPLLALLGCTDADKAGDDTSVEGISGMTFWPPEAGRGTEVDARIEAGGSVFNFGGTTNLDLGAGVTVNSVTVLDGWSATANLTIEAGAELGPRTAAIDTGRGEYSIGDALTIVDDSFTLTPDRARIGESVVVEILGQNTEWENGTTWANFGDEIEVTAVDVLSETYAVATVTVGPEAIPGFRDVAMEVGPDLTTLYNGFQVDRVALSARFDPVSAAQGETVEFTIEGSGTHFSEDSEIEFWKGGYENGDVVVDSVTIIDAENLFGRMTVSNAAEIGFRDVMVTTDDEGVFMEDAFEVTDGEADLTDVGISLAFYVARGIDNATGAISEVVVGQAIFYIPLDPSCPNSPEAYACSDGEDNDGDNFIDCYDNDCSNDPACASGPMPYDANGVFPTYTTGGTSDCPSPITLGAGDYVWFESDCNIVQLEKFVDGASGMIYYTADLTLDDYCFDQLYDLHTQGEDGGIGEYVLEEVQPTVPADFHMVDPEWWGNFTHNRAEDLTYTWTPAQTYPDAFFVTQISGNLVATGEGGFAGSIPWDDGEHTYTSDELSQLEPGNATFVAVSTIPEGPAFGFPFSTIQTNKSSTSVQVQGTLVLE